MKHCPQCQKRFPDDAAVCPHDGTPLKKGSSDGGSRQSPRQAPGSDGLVGRSFFGEYTVEQKLGEGGMGAVYLARQNEIDQSVALKVLHAKAAESHEIVQRFHREAKVISMLTHPNIVRVFIFGRTDDDLLYMVMEYVEGRELRHRLDRLGALEEGLAIKIMKQTCSALAEAHDLSIIHRDLKPDNILLTRFRGEENFVKILDFGIAKIKQPDAEDQKKLTKAGIVYGTPEYVSPEQAQAIDLDHRTDIYSLGCILYEMMTGQVPFRASNPVQTLTKHVYEEAPAPSEVSQRPIAPTMERIIQRAMAKDPDDRFDNALQMYEALVAREREMVEQKEMSAGDTYFPGSELTGLHQISSVAELTDEDAQESRGSQGALASDGGSPSPAPAQSSARSTQTSGGTQKKFIVIAIAVLVFMALVLMGLLGILWLRG